MEDKRPTTNVENPIRPLGLGEVVLRVTDLEKSISFYRDVLGFRLIRTIDHAIAFMRIADGVEGHTQIIGLFSTAWPSNREGKIWNGSSPERSTLHHFAIEISLDAHDAILEYLVRQNLNPNTQTHQWIGWRSIYVSDPDGHTIEFVCYDESPLDS
ncbi:VOC family protein [Iodidimonas sp. SYSU 1G8]|uniref:VOC family protein n=1 Tax=Iodidimonas sp. SYSU 1G8 TaxID=3133967 RepID=UPI0031FE82E9